MIAQKLALNVHLATKDTITYQCCSLKKEDCIIRDEVLMVISIKTMIF